MRVLHGDHSQPNQGAFFSNCIALTYTTESVMERSIFDLNMEIYLGNQFPNLLV